jgi:hypothetical protein
MKRALALALVGMLLVMGCQPEPEPEPEPELPPEPTKEEIHRELTSAVQVLWRPLSQGGILSRPEVEGAIANLRTARQKHAQHIHLPDAETDLRRELQALIENGRTTDRWLVVKGGIGAYNLITPNSTRYEKLDKLADEMLSRPRVRVMGFMTVDGDTFIKFRVQDVLTDEVTHESARVGERFADGRIQVEEIIGLNQRVRLNYLSVGDDQWVVVGPKERD